MEGFSWTEKETLPGRKETWMQLRKRIEESEKKVMKDKQRRSKIPIIGISEEEKQNIEWN